MTAAAPAKPNFTSRSFCVEASEQEHFELFMFALRKQIKPNGALEEYHFQIVVQTAWNLQRLAHHESEILSAYGNPFLDERLGKILDRISRYRRNMERSHSEAFKTLQLLQATRRQNEPDPEEEPPILPPIQVHLVTKRTQSAPVPPRRGHFANPRGMGDAITGQNEPNLGISKDRA